MCSCVSDVRGCVCLLDGKVCLYDVIVVCATRRTVMAAKFVKLSDQIIAGAIDAVRNVNSGLSLTAHLARHHRISFLLCAESRDSRECARCSWETK